MWQICGHIPQTLVAHEDISTRAAKLSVSFFIETFIHAKEKVNAHRAISGDFSFCDDFLSLLLLLLAHNGALGGAIDEAV